MARPKFIAFSPKTQVTSTITSIATEVEVDNIGSFPDVAAGEYGYITFLYDERSSSENPADYETCTYTGKTGSMLTGLTRQVEGAAQEWATGKYCFSGKTKHSDDVIWDRVEQVEGTVMGFKNTIINGDFRINQRGKTSGGTLVVGAYGHDRWKAGTGGCDYSFATVENKTTITIPATRELLQIIEGENLQSGNYTLSWEGTAQGKIGAGSYADSPITASVTGGTNLTITFGAGTLANVQLESGSVATPFEQRPLGLELSLCQRYYWVGELSGGANYTIYVGGAITTSFAGSVSFPVNMRVSPTPTIVTTPNLTNCSDVVISVSTTGLSQRVTILSAAHARARDGVYSADAEL